MHVKMEVKRRKPNLIHFKWGSLVNEHTQIFIANCAREAVFLSDWLKFLGRYFFKMLIKMGQAVDLGSDDVVF